MALDRETIAEILAQTHPQAKIAAPRPLTIDDGVELSDAVTPNLSELRAKFLPDDVLGADAGDGDVVSELPDGDGPEQTWVDVKVGDAEPKSMLIDDKTQSIILEQG